MAHPAYFFARNGLSSQNPWQHQIENSCGVIIDAGRQTQDGNAFQLSIQKHGARHDRRAVNNNTGAGLLDALARGIVRVNRQPAGGQDKVAS